MTLEEHCVWEKCCLRFRGYHQSPLKNSGCTFGKIDENVFGLFSDHMDLSLGSTKHVLGHIPQIDLGIQTGAWWLGDAGTTSASRPLRWRPGARMNHKIYLHTNFDLFCNIDSSTPPSEHQHGGGLPRLTPWCMDVRFVTLSESHQMLWWDMVGNHAHAIQSISKRNNLPSWMIVVNPGQAWGETTSKAGQSNCPALQQRHRSPAGRGLRAPIAYT